jgi:hypothetical protein
MSQNQIVLGHIAEGEHRGERFCIPRGHTVFTGMSHISGKTTAEEAVFSRLPDTDPPYRVLVFLTKRGEKTFQDSHNVKPYFKINFGWEYLESLMASAMKEKLKFERAWIIKLAKMTTQEMTYRKAPEASALMIAREILGKMIADKKTRDFDRNIYIVLAAYMDKILPVLRTAMLEWSQTLQLEPGINVMDLTPWYTNEEIQMLVIRSCMEHVLTCENKIIIALPECWKMIPQSRNTPVKLYFEKYSREGATNEDYLYLDAQDLGGMDKLFLRQVSVWIMGRMQESNEVERLLKQMLGVDMEAGIIQTLPLGHFIVAYGDKITKVYVWPKGVPEEMSIAVAKGEKSPEEVKEYLKSKNKPTPEEPLPEETPAPPTPEALPLPSPYGDDPRDTIRHSLGIDTIEDRLSKLEGQLIMGPVNDKMLQEYQELSQVKRTVKVTPAEKISNLTTDSADGKVMWLAKEGYLKEYRSQNEIEKTLTEHHFTVPRISLYKGLERLVKAGYLSKQDGKPNKYALASFVEFL